MNRYLCLAAAGIVLLLCALCCQVWAQVELSLHADTSKKCAICHYKWVSTFFLEHRNTPIAQADNKSMAMFSREVCISCHDASVRDSRSTICNDPGHQVGRIPSKRVSIPSGFPLDENGALKCTTCHTPHAVTEESESMVTYFLRAPNENSSFCRTCHQQKLGGLAQGNHPLDVSVDVNTAAIRHGGGKFGTDQPNQIICETCHRAHGGVNDKRLVLSVENTQTMSVLCEVCHKKNAILPGKISDATVAHPVDVRPKKGIRIPQVWSNGEKVALGRRGEIVCRTCHRPHQADRKFLLATPKGKDALCMQCHSSQASAAGPLPELRDGVSVEQQSTSKASAADFSCAACHLVHNGSAVFSLARDVADRRSGFEQFFFIPHFELHPRTFFGSAFLKQDGGKTDHIFLFSDSGEPSDNGTIVCATCHNVRQASLNPTDTLKSEVNGNGSGSLWQDTEESHNGLQPALAAAEGRLGADNDSGIAGFLRPNVAEKFCKACHGEEALVRFLYFHKKW